MKRRKKTGKIFCYYKIKSYLCIAFEKQRALSSAGSEHLPYKQRVGGSNPSAPTLILNANIKSIRALSSAGSEHLPYKQRVGGSNPSAPTSNREKILGRLAQLVQSICLTSRGSAVRIRQRPRRKSKRIYSSCSFCI